MEIKKIWQGLGQSGLGHVYIQYDDGHIEEWERDGLVTANTQYFTRYGRERKKVKQMKKDEKGKYVIVRTYSAGVYAGTLESREGKEVVLSQARRIWRWEGAASLSQLAMEGTSKPGDCKFPVEVNRVLLTEAIEILDVTERARQSIASVPVWSE